MVKFLRASNQQPVIALDLGDNKTTWVGVTPELKKFVIDNFHPGEEVEIESNKSSSGSLVVTKIVKPGSIKPVVKAEVPGAVGPGVSEAVQKNATTEIPKQEAQKGFYPKMSEDTQKLIVKQSVMSSTCDICQGVVCQLPTITPEEVASFVLKVYTKLLAEVEK